MMLSTPAAMALSGGDVPATACVTPAQVMVRVGVGAVGANGPGASGSPGALGAASPDAVGSDGDGEDVGVPLPGINGPDPASSASPEGSKRRSSPPSRRSLRAMGHLASADRGA